jgi:hypothetical protein
VQRVSASPSRMSQVGKNGHQTRFDKPINEFAIKYGPNGRTMSMNGQQKVFASLHALVLKAIRE